ncbi:MAG: molybdenum cofactor biosynthesis protein MoaE [bacterium]
MGALERCFLTRERLDVGALLAEMDDPACGALAVFVGRVREEQEGRAVLSLGYEAYDVLALKRMRALLSEARMRWNLGPLLLAHRVGRLEVGEAAVLVAATSGHRDAAFAACAFIVSETKAKVPVWKREYYADFGEAWVGLPPVQGVKP